jgi:ribosomal protein S18 acetylase RimI-like enzyme
MLSIEPIQPSQIQAARLVIAAVAGRMFEPDMSTEEFTAVLDADHELDDLDDLPGQYEGQYGLFLVAVDDGRVVGTAAIRALDGMPETQTAELRRIWLLEEYHGQGVASHMVSQLFAFARMAGYRRVVLQTSIEQQRALAFYRKLGFSEIPPYYQTPWEGEIFMGRELDG